MPAIGRPSRRIMRPAASAISRCGLVAYGLKIGDAFAGADQPTSPVEAYNRVILGAVVQVHRTTEAVWTGSRP
jgi:hypothetical protein